MVENEEHEQLGESSSRQRKSLLKSPGGASGFSGTTARMSRSAQDFSNIDSGTMLDALVDLSTTSDNLLKFLIPSSMSETSIAELMRRLHTKGSRERKNFDRLLSTLLAQKEAYESEGYIDTNKVLKILFGERYDSDDDASPWRPDELLQKANLAMLAANIFDQSQQQNDAPFWEELDHKFPTYFANEFASPNMLSTSRGTIGADTFNLALELRTHYAVTLLGSLRNQSDYDSDNILKRVFLESNKELRGWPVSGLQPRDMTKEVRNAILSRLEELRIVISRYEEGSTKCIEFLQTKWAWGIFVQQAIFWIGQRLTVLDEQVSVRGGADAIVQNLKDEVESTTSAKSSFGNEGANDEIILQYDIPSEAVQVESGEQDIVTNKLQSNAYRFDQFR